ncbi:MAG: branched-chain amino acid ABC transporter permease [Candidatus Bathyarchaeia archaeon]
MDILTLIDFIVNGLFLGGLFALTAFGLSVLAGIMKIINIAHGDFAILAAYLAFTITAFLGIDPFLSVVIVAPIMFVIGYLLQRFIVNRLIPRGGFYYPALSTFALSILIQNLLLLVFTADARTLIPPYLVTSIRIFGLNPSPRFLIAFISSIVVFVVIYFFFKKTYLGKAMRAVPFDPRAAKIIGIKSEAIYCFATGLAFLVTAISGVLLGMTFTFYPDTGPTFVLLSFGVIVMGGWGSLRGSLVGGIIMGEALSLSGLFFGSRFQLVVCYLLILVILSIKPQGIFGGRV